MRIRGREGGREGGRTHVVVDEDTFFVHASPIWSQHGAHCLGIGKGVRDRGRWGERVGACHSFHPPLPLLPPSLPAYLDRVNGSLEAHVGGVDVLDHRGGDDGLRGGREEGGEGGRGEGGRGGNKAFGTNLCKTRRQEKK